MDDSKWYKKPEMLVAFSALLISVVTTIVGIYSAYVDRSYARASVWPRIQIARSYNEQSFELWVTNSGTGPAIIKHAEVTFKDRVIHQWKDLGNIPNFIQSHLSSHILPSQQKIKPIMFNYKKKAEIDSILRMDDYLTINICYCSIYNECWETDRNNRLTEVERCEINEEDKFLQ